jgi:hypothetical protein
MISMCMCVRRREEKKDCCYFFLWGEKSNRAVSLIFLSSISIIDDSTMLTRLNLLESFFFFQANQKLMEIIE